ncbi:MAG: hypothetical protein KF819_00660 [Labilithrix sp.]|nr:hypothetical protein [Labilithrix sp.]
MRSSVVIVASTVLALSACRVSVEDRRRVVSRDRGTLCVGAAVAGDGGDTFGVDLHEGQPLPVSVKSGCLSNGCATERSAKCSVQREGDKLVVKSELSWRGPEDLGYRCPQECTPLEARCVSEPLPAGKYQVVLGKQHLDVTLPSHLDAGCASEASRIVVPRAPPPASVTAAPSAAPPKPIDPDAMPAPPGTGVAAEPPETDKICVEPGTHQKDRSLKVNQPISINVFHKNKCLGSSCSGATARCTVKRQGKRIILSAQFPTLTTKPRVPCTEDCNPFVAACRTDALPAGLYTIEHGAQQTTLQIPTANAPSCE